VNIQATPCSLWQNGAATLTQHLAQIGDTHPTYALFTGPPGNSYAASWQPCAQQYLNAQGWSKVYTGYNVWTPQGETQGADSLLASGKNPDVIILDAEDQQFIQAFQAAHKTMPVIVIGGSNDIGSFTEFSKLQGSGAKIDEWGISSQVWMLRVAVVAGLEVADGQKPSSHTLNYPMNVVSFSTAIKYQDLSLPSTAIAGSLLSPQDVAEALKY
jgi:hypothetical protein